MQFRTVPFLLALAFMLCLFPITAMAGGAQTYSFEFFGGTAYNFSTPLKIKQDGQEDISLNAKYDSNAFGGDTPYYAVRLGVWGEDSGWELELVHHKIYLLDNPPEIERFEISHGYNLLTVNRGWKKTWGGSEYQVRVGAGLTITHPEVTIRGQGTHDIKGDFDTGIAEFDVSGYTSQVSVSRRFYFSERIFGVLESKFTASTANAQMETASANAPNIAIHALFGLRFDYKHARE